MADGTSAQIFRFAFELFGKDPTTANRKLARQFWKESFKYDFSPERMAVDDALVALGLAARCKNCQVIDYDGDDPHAC